MFHLVLFFDIDTLEVLANLKVYIMFCSSNVILFEF